MQGEEGNLDDIVNALADSAGRLSVDVCVCVCVCVYAYIHVCVCVCVCVCVYTYMHKAAVGHACI